MRVTKQSADATPQQTATANSTRTAQKRDAEPSQSASAPARDFASVLDEMARPRRQTNVARETDDARRDDGDTAEVEDGAETDDASAPQFEREREARRREGRRDADSNSGFDARSSHSGQVRQAEPVAEAAPNARAILHIADLERIVSAVRTQTALDGRREITLELRRSVLEGLRVKLSADESGKITAEFIAASERTRAQLDARAPELSDLLRSRGVNLAALRTTVGAESAGGQNAGGRGNFGPDAFTNRAPAPAAASIAPAASSDSDESAAGDVAGRTYRA